MGLLGRARSGTEVVRPAAPPPPAEFAGGVGVGPLSRLRRALHLPALRIRWRLTIFFSIVLALMLSSFSLFFYWYMSGSMMRDIDRTSRDRAIQVVDGLDRYVETSRAVGGGLLLTPAELSLLERWSRLDTIAGDWLLQGVAVRLYDASGRLVDYNDDSVGQRLTDPARMPVDYGLVQAANQGRIHRVKLATRDLGAYYSFSQPVLLNGRPWAAVEILTPLETYNLTLERLQTMLIFGTLLATGLASFAGAAVAEAALSPIDAITRTARRINEKQDLSQRVPDDGRGDELGRLSSTINAMLDQVEGMLDRQRRFLSDVSHELRTPLTTIRGEAELMERSGDMDAEGLAAIRGEAERMSRMVEDLLMLAHTDEESRLDREAVDLSALLQDVGRQAQLLGGDHHRVLVQADKGLSVTGDRDRLKQLVLNLVGNALSHTPAGTTLRLGLKRLGGAAEIEVSDDGPGIPEDDLPYLFDRFYRVDKARNRSSGGTGLGLAIVQSIARAHHGEVHVKSTPEQGTAFRVQIPLRAPEGKA